MTACANHKEQTDSTGLVLAYYSGYYPIRLAEELYAFGSILQLLADAQREVQDCNLADVHSKKLMGLAERFCKVSPRQAWSRSVELVGALADVLSLTVTSVEDRISRSVPYDKELADVAVRLDAVIRQLVELTDIDHSVKTIVLRELLKMRQTLEMLRVLGPEEFARSAAAARIVVEEVVKQSKVGKLTVITDVVTLLNQSVELGVKLAVAASAIPDSGLWMLQAATRLALLSGAE